MFVMFMGHALRQNKQKCPWLHEAVLGTLGMLTVK